MKYLRIYKVLGLLIIIMSILFELFYTLCIGLIYFIWTLKFPINLWEILHTYKSYEDYINDKIVIKTYSDKNPLETIKRRYHTFFK